MDGRQGECAMPRANRLRRRQHPVVPATTMSLSIVLTPVRMQRTDAVRARLAELDLTEADITDAVSWARSPGAKTKPKK